jgi:hypothetical protein
MTQGTEKILGGTRYKRYPDPNVSNLPNQFGLYPWSSFRARLGQFDGNGVIQPSVFEDVASNGLLFLSDAPAIVRAGFDVGGPFYYSDGTAVLSFLVGVQGLVTQPGGATNVELKAFGEVAKGYTGAASDVYCIGFPVFLYYDPPFQPLDDYALFVEALANGPVINSPISGSDARKRFPVSETGTGITPIILKSTDYTDAIKANNNVITCADPVGIFTSVSYVVVGIWFPLAPL